ncbi:MAG: 3-hydroxybutyryl-CoA dehydratase [Candidatus Azotimanducaceae bacterium]|jgi:3-hydroxybutyryl-CoA dehydratase
MTRMNQFKSRTYKELEIGDQGRFSKTVTERDIALFGEASGDVNPVHFDEAYAAKTIFRGRIAHGLWSASLISTCIGTVMPGPGSIYLEQTLEFKLPARLGDNLTAVVTIEQKIDAKKLLTLNCVVTNQNNEVVVSGEAKVIPPRKSAELNAPALPAITVAGLQ